jgi:hypothetical protein
MTEFTKIASAIKMWGWGRAGMILAAPLLFRHVVTFDQALILILLNVVLDRSVYGKQPPPTGQNRSSAAIAKTLRRSKPLPPSKSRPVRTGGGLAAATARPHSSKNGVHRTLGARRIENVGTNK